MIHSWQKRFLALFLAVVMVIGYIPTSVFAAEDSELQEQPAGESPADAAADALLRQTDITY